MKPVNLLRDIRQANGPRSDAQHLADRAAFVARMRHERALGITYVAPSVRRRAA